MAHICYQVFLPVSNSARTYVKSCAVQCCAASAFGGLVLFFAQGLSGHSGRVSTHSLPDLPCQILLVHMPSSAHAHAHAHAEEKDVRFWKGRRVGVLIEDGGFKIF